MLKNMIKTIVVTSKEPSTTALDTYFACAYLTGDPENPKVNVYSRNRFYGRQGKSATLIERQPPVYSASNLGDIPTGVRRRTRTGPVMDFQKFIYELAARNKAKVDWSRIVRGNLSRKKSLDQIAQISGNSI
jgi:hypothetical protein